VEFGSPHGAAAAVARVLAAVGIQDAFDDALSEYFFEAFYRALPIGLNPP
jgi:hypothetical protein